MLTTIRPNCRPMSPLVMLALFLALQGCSAAQTKAAPAKKSRLTPARAATAIQAPQPEAARVPNAVFITAKDAAKRPFTISRVFAQGDLPHFAQAIVNGEPVETQCDVMTRWPDNSIQHALISFWANLAKGDNVVGFVDYDKPSNDGELKAESLLSPDYNFGAVMELTANGQTQRVDARKMLEAGAFRYWLKGPICTQVIIEDRTPALAFDVGSDQYRNFHPIFVATFYPGWKGVKTEFIGENVWIGKMQNIAYSLALKTENPLKDQPVYTKSNFSHAAFSRWRKVFWSGPEPGSVRVDYNFPYMIYSRVVPNYDLSKKVPAAAMDGLWAAFSKGDRGDLGGSALWTKGFGAGGARGDIGILPTWYVIYLYTFDPKMEEIFLGNASVSGQIPIHFRESQHKPYLRDDGIDGFGRVLSIEARPTVYTVGLDYAYQAPKDRVTFVGGWDFGGWGVDLAHQASFAFVPYVITGDWYYLEELQFWAAYDVAAVVPGDCRWCRKDDWGFLNSSVQTRGSAWGLRNLGQAAFATPDKTPEKIYFLDKLYNNIAVNEGVQSIVDGAFYDPSPGSPWSWGPVVIEKRTNPLHYMDIGGAPEATAGWVVNLDPNSPYRAGAVNSPWQYNYMHVVLGHLEELGLPIGPLRRVLATHLLHQLTRPDFNHYLAAAYRVPQFMSDGSFYQDWPSLLKGFNSTMQTNQGWPSNDDGDMDGYPHILRAAASYLPGICDQGNCGTGAWDWVDKHVGHQDLLNGNPRWAIVPRSTQTVGALQTELARKHKVLKKSVVNLKARQ